METKKTAKTKMDLLTAVEMIVDLSKDSKLEPEFFTQAAKPIKYISKKMGLTKEQSVLMALFIDNSVDTNIRINAVAPGSTVTPAHLANKAGEQPGGAKMLEYSKHFVYFPGPECDPMDQANACLFLASDMGKHVKGQVIQVCNGAFL